MLTYFSGACGNKHCIPVYLHDIRIKVMDKFLPCKAGFYKTELPESEAVLGRNGIFDGNIITFEPSRTIVTEL